MLNPKSHSPAAEGAVKGVGDVQHHLHAPHYVTTQSQRLLWQAMELFKLLTILGISCLRLVDVTLSNSHSKYQGAVKTMRTPIIIIMQLDTLVPNDKARFVDLQVDA